MKNDYTLPTKPWQRCNGKKKCYPSKKEAETYLNIYKEGFGRKHFKEKPCRVYPCDQCNAWHLTSKIAGFLRRRQI